MLVKNIDYSFGNPISGFEHHKSVSEQIEILEEFFEKSFFLNNQQNNMLKKEFLTKKLILVPFFDELIETEPVSHARPLRSAMSALWKKYRNSMEVDNHIQNKYVDGYRRTSRLINNFTELWHSQDLLDSLIIVLFEFLVAEDDPKILYKKIFYPNINGEFIFGAYETVVAKVLFGNDELGESLIPVLCVGDEITGESSKTFPNMPCLEYDDSGIQIKLIPKEDPYSPAGYFKGFVF